MNDFRQAIIQNLQSEQKTVQTNNKEGNLFTQLETAQYLTLPKRGWGYATALVKGAHSFFLILIQKRYK